MTSVTAAVPNAPPTTVKDDIIPSTATTSSHINLDVIFNEYVLSDLYVPVHNKFFTPFEVRACLYKHCEFVRNGHSITYFKVIIKFFIKQKLIPTKVSSCYKLIQLIDKRMVPY